jgi:hypothetical protein
MINGMINIKRMINSMINSMRMIKRTSLLGGCITKKTLRPQKRQQKKHNVWVLTLLAPSSGGIN